MDEQHSKLFKIHFRCRKVFDLFKVFSLLSGFFDTAAEGALSRIITCVNLVPFGLMYFSLLKCTWNMCVSSKSDTYYNKRLE
jgi:hypothetical protein